MKKFMKIMGDDMLSEKYNVVDSVVYGLVLFGTLAAVMVLAGVIERMTA